ncbi:epimerase family protein SDR39U1-like [Portunus trituberculatus]|uniref:epimerase family protein SDR39U1-like n=1 Tax=Portunus trituberculatus TaxID=210409 RepID=UPI001E1CCC39|nr:epimerase family protein SDR39U1-like [Portunus trituberculatus]
MVVTVDCWPFLHLTSSTGGGTGFIGTALTKSLQHHGYDVVLVSRKPGLYRLSWNDLNKKGLPESTVAVVSLAGQNVLDPLRRWTEGFKQNVWASRVNTTRYLAAAIESAKVKPKVFVSASGVVFSASYHILFLLSPEWYLVL